MNKFLSLSTFFISIFILILTGCSIGTMESRGYETDESISNIDPFDFGDEFLQQTIKNKDSDTGENTADKDIPYSQINTDIISTNNEKDFQSGENSITIYPDSTVSRLGYRVQIGAFEYKNNADKMAESVLSKTDIPIYVEYITPFYRVRLGNFTEKSEAEECVKLLKEKGFNEALWVYTNINTQ